MRQNPVRHCTNRRRASCHIMISLTFAVLLLGGCSSSSGQVGGTIDERFLQHDPTKWIFSTKHNTDPAFKSTAWGKDRVCVGNGLVITLMGCRHQQDCATPTRPFVAGEYQSIDTYHYGQYFVRMKAAKGSGLVTGFFILYIAVDVSGQITEHDEIDIEILGKDTTKAQINYYSNGKPLCEPQGATTYSTSCGQPSRSLGFDAATGYHDYIIDWQPTYIRWWWLPPTGLSILSAPWEVLFTADGTGMGIYEPPDGIPNSAGKVVFNLWASCTPTWAGPCTFSHPVSAYFDSVSYSNAGPNYNPNLAKE